MFFCSAVHFIKKNLHLECWQQSWDFCNANTMGPRNTHWFCVWTAIPQRYEAPAGRNGVMKENERLGASVNRNTFLLDALNFSLCSICEMSQTKADDVLLLETRNSSCIYAIAFSTDKRHLFSGSRDGTVQQINIANGLEVARWMAMATVWAISVSRDGKWVAYGTRSGVNVWDPELREKVVDVEDGNNIMRVDFSPDSTCLATCTAFPGTASVWDIATGERIVGPLEFDNIVTCVCFSPDGQRIATSVWTGPINIFDSHTGDNLVTIDTKSAYCYSSTWLAWTSDGQRVFAPCQDNKVKSYDASTGTQLLESQVIEGGDRLISLALASNEKFIATYVGSSISFLDSATLSRIGPVIKDSEHNRIYSIALSPDSSYLLTGRGDGKIAVRNLTTILLDSFFETSTPEGEQHGERDSASGGNVSTGSNSVSSHHDSGPHSRDDVDLLEAWLYPSF
ncbi:WD40-repeat-containing domain protein [Chiua virens]|nr:WD40-repeat-containing domain protein [Chiua virens]